MPPCSSERQMNDMCEAAEPVRPDEWQKCGAQRVLGSRAAALPVSAPIRSLFPSSSRPRPPKQSNHERHRVRQADQRGQRFRSAAAACACTRLLLPWHHNTGLGQQPQACRGSAAAAVPQAAAARARPLSQLPPPANPSPSMQRISEAAGAAAQRASDTWEATKEKASEVRAARSGGASFGVAVPVLERRCQLVSCALSRSAPIHSGHLHGILPVPHCAALLRQPALRCPGRPCPPPTQYRRSPAPAFLPLNLPQLTGSAQQGGAEARAQGEGAWEQTKGKATEMGHRAGGCCSPLASLLRIFSPSVLETVQFPVGPVPFNWFTHTR